MPFAEAESADSTVCIGEYSMLAGVTIPMPTTTVAVRGVIKKATRLAFGTGTITGATSLRMSSIDPERA